MPYKNLENAQKFIIFASTVSIFTNSRYCVRSIAFSLSLKLDRKVNKYFGQENNEADDSRGAFWPPFTLKVFLFKNLKNDKIGQWTLWIKMHETGHYGWKLDDEQKGTMDIIEHQWTKLDIMEQNWKMDTNGQWTQLKISGHNWMMDIIVY